MYQVEYKNADGLKRTMACNPDELFALFKNFGDCNYLKVLSVWRTAQGYMEKVSVKQVRNKTEVRDLWGDLIEAR